MWGRDQLEQLKVTPLTNWDIWWALTIPAVRSLAVLLIYGIVFSSILATVGREPPENRWRELSGDDYAVQSLLAVGLLSLIVAGSLLLVFVRRSGKAGPLLFARVVVITVMAGGVGAVLRLDSMGMGIRFVGGIFAATGAALRGAGVSAVLRAARGAAGYRWVVR
jgi:hypothetical protein